MIHRTGDPYNMDSKNGNAFLQGNMANSLPIQFPPPRIPANFQGHTNLGGNGGGLQQSLSMLCVVAVGDQPGGKRTASDELMKNEAVKRHKIGSREISKDNPVLMERLSSLGGGFPMPKWAGFQRSTPKEAQPVVKQPTPMLGAFPLPPLKDRKSSHMSLALSSYKDLWQNADHELRKEILARRLEHGNIKVMEGRMRSCNLR